MNRAYGDARNVAAQPSSWRCPTLRAGWQTSLSEVDARLPWMSAVMSSCGMSPGTRQFTWIPYGPHSTARVSVRFFTPAFAAEECANPGPPVQAYDAPTLTIEPGISAASSRRPYSRHIRNVPLRVMSTTVRHALGDRSSVGDGKLAAALLTSTPGSPNRAVDAVERRGDAVGVADVALDALDLGAERGDRVRAASRCSGLRLSTARSAPRRANSDAIALPSPVPPPVTTTVTPSKVPGTSAVAPGAGGWGSPRSSVIGQLPV